ncbi:DUF3221 domain-containing protein [Ureibacillus sp. FSL E2-3493]|uniref:DUF3221 domain-containing protein n=1 Tax=Ureibacillus sp. FSL E2-3493 TaxID=2921367 RepID=UPI0031197052
MKVKLILYLFLIFCFLPTLVSCENSSSPEPDIVTDNASVEGIIIFDKKSGKKILIQDTNFNYDDMELPLNTLLDKYYNKVLFLSFKDESLLEHIQTGQKVKVWYSEILESNPPTYKVNKLEVSEN